MTTVEFNNQLIELQHKLNYFALSLTSDEDEAKDLLQETYLKALIHCEKFQTSTNLKAWTYTIMKNTFINNYRKNVRQNVTFDNTNDSFLLSQNKDTFNVEPDSALREKEISTAIEQLDDDYKEPFKMCIQGYKYKEIAQILGLRIGTVKSRIFFTRRKLVGILCDYN